MWVSLTLSNYPVGPRLCFPEQVMMAWLASEPMRKHVVKSHITHVTKWTLITGGGGTQTPSVTSENVRNKKNLIGKLLPPISRMEFWRSVSLKLL